MRTEEELKEAKRIANAKWYAKNKKPCMKTKKKKRAKYYAENKETLKERQAKWRANSITHFVVYAHTNSKGNIYIGCGSNIRPYDFHNGRSKEWRKAFDNECEIKILGEFKYKKQALTKEKELINAFGLNNLVNAIA